MSEHTHADARRRAWRSVVLMVPLLALFMFPTLMLLGDLRAPTGTDTESQAWADLGYALVTVTVYVATVAVALPIFAHTVAYAIDARTRDRSDRNAAVIFGIAAAGLGLLLAVPIALLSDYRLIPFLTFCLAPGLAAVVTRMLLPVVMRLKAARIASYLVAVATLLPFVVIAVLWFADRATG